MAGGHTLDAADIRLEVAHIDCARHFDEWQKNVQSGSRDAMKAAEPLDDHHFGLTDDLERSRHDHERNDCDDPEKNQTTHWRLSKMSVVNMQKKTPPCNSRRRYF